MISIQADNNKKVVIVGAGPVGLLLSLLLAKKKIPSVLLEKSALDYQESRAIGIMPPSMKTLKEVGLIDDFLELGIKVSSVNLYEAGAFVGNLTFDDLQQNYPFILSIPQSASMEILRRHADRSNFIKIYEEVEYIEHCQVGDGVLVKGYSEKNKCNLKFRASKIIACDGVRSKARANAKISFPLRHYKVAFCMADFVDTTTMGSEACLYFGPDGSVESFPLPLGRRRWIVQVNHDHSNDHDTQPADSVIDLVRRRIGMNLNGSKVVFQSCFSPAQALAKRFFDGDLILCGDAAHVMPPIGGQGMNTGFADAVQLAKVMERDFKGGLPGGKLSLRTSYERCRKKSFRHALRIVNLGMWFGTRKGVVFSFLRLAILKLILRNEPLNSSVVRAFSMASIPRSNLRPFIS
jgi:2-polyprenyl-6-methoxyphenol hydroxylase-like FAD-dependent oxidoreductase